MKRFCFVIFIITSVPLTAGEGRRRVVAFPQPFPPCAMITGTPAVTFTRDGGATLTPTVERLKGVAYTYGLAVLNPGGTLLAWHKSDLILSNDHGCSWRTIASFHDYDFPPRIVAAANGERAYAWSDNRTFLVRYDGRGAVKLKQPVAFVGFVVDRNDPDHVRAGGSDGSIWDSGDAGETWTRIGAVAVDRATIFYRAAFDPANLDHAIFGTAVTGAMSTQDGRNWSRVRIEADNVFEVVFSPADSNVVWAEGLDLDTDVKSIYRSVDGGATFTAVVNESESVHLINGALLAPHPTNPAVLYFVFGTYFQNYGTDIYRYDASRRALSITHNDANDVNAIAFSPLRPNLMYLGLEVESGGQ